MLKGITVKAWGRSFLFYAFIGAAVLIGFRTVEWLIPKPESKSQVIVCYMNAGEEHKGCEANYRD